MRKFLLVAMLLVSASFVIQSQTTDTKTAPSVAKAPEPDKKPPVFGISFSGFVKTDFFYDSRQTVNSREGHFLLFPENEKLDANGADINAKSSFNFLSIQTRLAGTITGPDALGAKTSGYIEGEFFGNINTNINTFRLRHAWIKLNWKSTELMFGQNWHPMFVPECSPATVSFNTGAPFVVFSRNPQVRLTQALGPMKFSLTLLSQVDFVSDGPDGPSPKYLRNSGIPEANFHYQQTIKIGSAELLEGISINVQCLMPRLNTTLQLSPAYDTVINNKVVHYNAVTKSFKTDRKIFALAANYYARLKTKAITLKVGVEAGMNNNAYTMLGGYAVKSVTDPLTNEVDYTFLGSYAVWGDFHSNGTRWQPGLFVAYGKTEGSNVTFSGPAYTRGGNIDYAYRVSPRIVFNAGKFRLAGEVEYTVAAYGKTNTNGRVFDTKEIANIRGLIGVFYFF